MRVAFIDHSFHERTGSSRFFSRALEEGGEVEIFWDDSWKTGRVDPGLVRKLVEGEFDEIVFFQVFWPGAFLDWLGLSGAVFVPMYDDVRKRTDSWWESYRGCRFVNFARALDGRLGDLAGERLDVQYFPEPVDRDRAGEGGLVGFFWQRRESLPWQTIWEVAGKTEWERFHLHWAPDPGQRRVSPPGESFCRENGVVLSEWFEELAEFHSLMSGADVYFAPRRHEGIGMGFLEAMARGQCVVAPDLPTHNEYIESGRNGWLFDPDAPEPIDLGRAREIGETARESCREGRRAWETQVPRIRDFVNSGGGTIRRDLLERALSAASPKSRKWQVRDPLAKRVARRIIRAFRAS